MMSEYIVHMNSVRISLNLKPDDACFEHSLESAVREKMIKIIANVPKWAIIDSWEEVEDASI